MHGEIESSGQLNKFMGSDVVFLLGGSAVSAGMGVMGRKLVYVPY